MIAVFSVRRALIGIIFSATTVRRHTQETMFIAPRTATTVAMTASMGGITAVRGVVKHIDLMICGQLHKGGIAAIASPEVCGNPVHLAPAPVLLIVTFNLSGIMGLKLKLAAVMGLKIYRVILSGVARLTVQLTG